MLSNSRSSLKNGSHRRGRDGPMPILPPQIAAHSDRGYSTTSIMIPGAWSKSLRKSEKRYLLERK
jgi:hypothetical protein